MRKSSVSKQSKHSSCSAAVIGRGSASRRANFLCQRATSGAPSAMRCAVASASAATSSSGTTRVTRPLLLRLGGAEDPALEQDLERDVGPDEAHERRHLRIGHHEPEVLDRRAEAARLAADAQIAQRGDLESAAHADAVDLRDQRMPARGERARRRVHDARRSRSPAPCSRARSRIRAMSLPGENAFSPAPRRITQRSVVVGGQRVDRRRPAPATSPSSAR